MTSPTFLDLLSVTGLLALGFFAMSGVIDTAATITSIVQEWRRSKKNINVEVPSLKNAVEELRRRQTRLEVGLEQMQRRRDHGASSLASSHERSAGTPSS